MGKHVVTILLHKWKKMCYQPVRTAHVQPRKNCYQEDERTPVLKAFQSFIPHRPTSLQGTMHALAQWILASTLHQLCSTVAWNLKDSKRDKIWLYPDPKQSQLFFYHGPVRLLLFTVLFLFFLRIQKRTVEKWKWDRGGTRFFVPLSALAIRRGSNYMNTVLP
jgi:hypothetical protein